MGKFNFDEIIERNDTDCLKYSAGANVDGLRKDHIPMWIADMDFACPNNILEAMKKRIDQRIIGYTMPYSEEYFNAVISWFKKRFNWDVKKETIVHSSGVVAALDTAVKQLTKEGDGVIFCTPAYTPFNNVTVNNKRVPVYSPLINTNGYFTFNYEEIEEFAKKKENTMFILCNPHNPTGRVWREDELRKVIDICLENDVFVISDEIHGDLTRVGENYIPALSLYPDCKKIIACTAPSKTFNIAGNQLSNIIIPDEKIAKAWWDAHLCGMPNPIALSACQAAYSEKESEEWLEEMKEYVDENMKYVDTFLKEKLPKAVFAYPEGTYLAWVDLSAYGNDEELEKKIGANGVYIEYGDRDFVRDAKGYVRINIACPKAVLVEAMDRIADALLK